MVDKCGQGDLPTIFGQQLHGLLLSQQSAVIAVLVKCNLQFVKLPVTLVFFFFSTKVNGVLF